MSAYTTLKTKMVSTEHLVRALKDVGLEEVEVHETPQPLVGWLGDGRAQKAEVIIRKRHVGMASNDIGFARDENGHFVALISDFDRARYNQAWLQSLVQGYAFHVVKDQLAEQDFSVVEESVDEERNIRIHVRRMAS